MEIDIIFLGKMNYKSVLQLQEKIRAEVMEGKRRNTLLLVEHNPVYTVGRNGDDLNILLPTDRLKEEGIEVYHIKRGGDVTYHGPGQIVGYPIVNLKSIKKGIKDYVYSLEDTFVTLLKEEYGIEAIKDTGKYTGVWVNNKKITAVGIEIKKWVTIHGFAFNVNTKLDYFNGIVPCGISDRGVTSLYELTGKEQNLDLLFKKVAEYFCMVFDLKPTYVDKNEWVGWMTDEKKARVD